MMKKCYHHGRTQKQHRRQMRDMPCSWKWTQHIKLSILIHKFNTIPIKIPTDFVLEQASLFYVHMENKQENSLGKKCEDGYQLVSDAVKPTDSQCGRCGPGPRRLSALRRPSAHTGTQAKQGSTAPHSGLRNTNNIQKRELSRLLNSKGFAV